MNRRHTADTVFVLLLYGLFVLVSLLLALIGVQVYRNIVSRTSARSEMRACLSYVANKVRSSPEVRLETRDGLTVLTLPETEGDEPFETLIYFYDGSLRELFQRQTDSFRPAGGEEIVSLTGFAVSESADGLLTVTSRDVGGEEHCLYIQKRTG